MGCGASQGQIQNKNEPLPIDKNSVRVQTKISVKELSPVKQPIGSVRESSKQALDLKKSSKSSSVEKKPAIVRSVSMNKSITTMKDVQKNRQKSAGDKTATNSKATAQSSRSSTKNIHSGNLGISPSKIKLDVNRQIKQNQQVQIEELNAQNIKNTKSKSNIKTSTSKAKKIKTDQKLGQLMRLYGV